MVKKVRTDKLREYERVRYAKRTALDDERRRANNKNYYSRNKERVLLRRREHHLKNNYGLSSQEYLERVVQQDNKCAICNKEEHRLCKTGDVKPLSVDHDHTTGKVRMLLCNDCNALLGFAKEDTVVLKNAIKYLDDFQPQNMWGH